MPPFSFLKRKSTPIVGIDISSTSIKLVELSRSGEQFRLEACAIEPLPLNAVVEKNISDINGVGAAIRKAWEKSGSKTKQCALATPSSAVISKQITIPASIKEQEREGQIRIEADQYIPYDLNEVNLDFEILGKNSNNPDLLDVLLIVSRTENIDVRVGAAELAGLEPKIMDVESYATERAALLCDKLFPDKGVDKNIAIIDIGHTMTSISVLENRLLAYTREQPFGGKLLTEEVMRHYSLSYHEAGLAKKTGQLPETYIPEVLEPFKDALVQQVHRLLQVYYAAGEHPSIDFLLLAGGSASIPGVDELVESRLEIPTAIANPFSDMKTSPKIHVHQLNKDAPALLIACGLAMRTLNGNGYGKH